MDTDGESTGKNTMELLWERSAMGQKFSHGHKRRWVLWGDGCVWSGVGGVGGIILRPFLAMTPSDLNSQKLNILFIPGAVRPAWDVVICRSYKFQKDTYCKTLGFVSTESSHFKWVEYFHKRVHIT